MSPKNTATAPGYVQTGEKTATMSALDTLLARNAMIWRRNENNTDE